MKIQNNFLKIIIAKLLKNENFDSEINNLLNEEFWVFATNFFYKVCCAKLDSKDITIDWYRNAFMNEKWQPDDYAINAGINKKTITNMHNTGIKTVVIETANEHFESLYQSIQALVEMEKEIDLTLTIKMKSVSVDLNVSESLIVINTLAVKRSALRGGLWSTAGKSAEKYLMLTLCKLYKVDEKYYDAAHFVKDKDKKVDREIDFYLLNNSKKYLCEVKLMGKGNPESADAIFARKSDIFIADTLSQQNKNQAEELKVNWVALREKDGYKRFKLALEKLNIPYSDFVGDLDTSVDRILIEVFDK
ncbi:hypothetical protein FACS189452_05320 [Bacteroidia bacterium]|nr:hypothetical protein FACS189452_05320 [Bacteroidia bacterium]GHT81045.1 hypothetical protein FACS189467_4440 [Bacteroidia bacterium]